MRALLIFLLPLLLISCSKVNKENYEQVKTDMEIEAVYQILGEPTEKRVKKIGRFSATAAYWREGGIEISVTAANGKVKAKDFFEGVIK